MSRWLVIAMAACGAAPSPAPSPHLAATQRRATETTTGRPTSTFPIVDFDDDGLADLAFSAIEQPGERCDDTPDGKTCARGRGPARATLLVYLGRDRGAVSQTIELATGPHPLAMGRAYEVGAVGDLDDDGHTDLAVTFSKQGSESLLLLRGTSNGLGDPYQSVPLPRLSNLQWYGLRPRPAGDVDGDGARDIVLGPAILHGIGAGKLGDPELDATSPTVYAMTLLPVGDVTDDGIDDLVQIHHAVPRLLPGGGSTTPLRLTTSEPIAAADLDGDGRAELVGVGRGAHVQTLTIYRLSAQGAVPDGRVDIPGDALHDIAIADVDGNRMRDLAVVVSIGRVEIACGTRCTTPANLHVRLARGPRWTLAPMPATSASAVAAHRYRFEVRALGDLDGDGREELGEVRDGALHVPRSGGGGPLVIARAQATAPREIELAPGSATFDGGR